MELLERNGATMWIGTRSRTDRILAAIEIPALGLWLGALFGFAFIQAPAAFAIIGSLDVGRFAQLTETNLRALAILGYVCGGLCIVIALVRSREAGDRIFDFVRALLALIAVGVVWVESSIVIPAMARIPDVHSAQYHAMHSQSSAIYGTAVILVLAALVMAAIRREN